MSSHLAKHLYRAGLLHDLGKTFLPKALLYKPQRLSPREFLQVQAHPLAGANLIAQTDPSCVLVLEGVRSHHERFDGNGYPYGIAGQSIPHFGRILAVADVFEALTSDRPYRKRIPVNVALNYLQRHAKTQFDPELVDVFIGLADAGALDIFEDIATVEALSFG